MRILKLRQKEEKRGPGGVTLGFLWGMSVIFILIVILYYGAVQAGSLSPTASPAATMYTLSDIYTRLTTNATATLASHAFAPSGSPAGTLYTLTQVYDAIPTISADKVGTGTSYLGVSGTLLGSLFNGASGGASQSNGGSDDYNNGGSPLSGRYAKSWTACNSGNSYCSTSDSGADIKDESTGLVWSLPCNGSGCATFSDSSPITYSWNSSAVNNNSRTASQLCSDHSGWSLPHQKQLMQTYIDGSYSNLEASGTIRAYWSATVVSNDSTSSWYTNLSSGETAKAAKTSSNYVRCVR